MTPGPIRRLVPPVEPLNYESLRKKQQLERGSPRLTRLESDFYHNLELYLQGLSEDLQREHTQNPHSSKATLLQDELQNTRRLAEDLYEHRERKVITGAIAVARGGNPDHAHMLPEERELHEALVAVLRDTKRRVLFGRPGRAQPAPHPVQAQGATTLAVQAAEAAPAPDEGRLLVRVLEDIGAFAASDLRTYNVKREEVVSLPTDTAKILILRGKAVEVAPPA